MYRSLLVPLDGSSFAEEALPLALKIADLAGASLEIMRVHEVYGVHDAYYSWSPYNSEVDAMLMERERAYLEAVVCRLQKNTAVPVTSFLADSLIEEGILGRVRTKSADLIVMATHGRGPMSRFWLGSVADALVRHAPVPILLVRPKGTSADLASKPTIRRILIPLDGSKLAETVLEPAIALGGLLGAEFTLLRAVQGDFLPLGEPLPEKLNELVQSQLASQRAEAQAYLDCIAERLRAKVSRIDSRVVVAASAVKAVLDMACSETIDLIAIATHGHGGLKRLLLGSVTDKVVRGASTPVLTYRPLPVLDTAPALPPAPAIMLSQKAAAENGSEKAPTIAAKEQRIT